MQGSTFAAEAVVWDMDGTLIDSEPLHERVFYAVCRRHGVDLSDLDAGVFVGVHQYDVWNAVAHRFPPGVSREAWLADLDAEYLADKGSLVAEGTPRELMAEAGSLAAQFYEASRS